MSLNNAGKDLQNGDQGRRQTAFTYDSLENSFDIVDVFQRFLATKSNVASTLLLVWTGLY